MKPFILNLVISILISNILFAQYWSPVSSGMSPGGVYAMAANNNTIYAAGQFDSAGQTAVYNIAKWDGQNWSGLNNGIPGTIYTMAFFNSELFVAGILDTSVVHHIRKWNGSNWMNVGGGLNNSVHSLCVYNGELYAGGYFVLAGGDSAYHIAKWNGTSWSPVGSGTNGPVVAMIVYNNELFVGGDFSEAGGQPALNIARWNGSTWSAIGNGMDNTVTAFAADQNNLFAGGWFTLADTVAAFQVARWDGIRWNALGSGLWGGYMGWGVQTLAIHNGKLYAGGEFEYAGSVPVSNIACWNGTEWSGLGTGTDHFTYSIISADSILYVGGIFSAVNQNITANRIAKWSDTCMAAPGQPGSITGNNNICQYTSQTYSIPPVNGALSYSWTLPSGWTGTSSTNYIITTVGSQSGDITVMAHNGCGAGISQQRTITVIATPVQPGPISGNVQPCIGSTQTYSVAPVPGASHYSWSVPPGWQGDSFTNTINAIVGQNPGLISVKAINACGVSVIRSLSLTPNTIIGAPSAISGNDEVCTNSVQVYSVDPVPGATHYNWLLPPGWTGSSTTNSITVTIGQSGSVSVTASNECGNSIPVLLDVTVRSVPEKPPFVYGYPHVCAGMLQTYTVQEVQDATSYSWILPAGWTGPVFGTSISVIPGNTGGVLMVRASNQCGSSDYLSGMITVDTMPPNPGPITGTAIVRKNETHDYSTGLVANATNYVWQCTGCLVSNSTLNTSKITWQKAGVQKLTVYTANQCFRSMESELDVSVLDIIMEYGYDLRIAPNPTSGLFYVLGTRLQDKQIRVEILNMAGQLVFRNLPETGSNNYSRLINISKFPVGNYVVKLVINNESFTKIISKTK